VPDYRVVPEALRSNVTQLDEAADLWQEAHSMLLKGKMPDNAFGWLGRAEDIAGQYNKAWQGVLDKLARGQEALARAATALDRVADDYERMDAAYYDQFGYLDRQSGH
jgi:uncharacterized protein YukE